MKNSLLRLLGPLVVLAPLSASPAPFQNQTYFEENVGQMADWPGYLARGLRYRAFVGAEGPLLILEQPKSRAVLRVEAVGANREARPEGLDRSQASVHYLKGSKLSAPLYERVRYHDVYDGVDVQYRPADGRLEYDFFVAPGADPQVIRLRFEGADGVTVESDGALSIRLGERQVRQPPPVIYQDGPAGRKTIDGGHQLARNGEVAFWIGDYDPTLPLVIDPVLDYSTYLGAGDDDAGHGVATDADGAIYVVGRTDSSDFPATAGAFAPNFGGDDSDAFVSKFNSDGSLVFSTFYGSESSDAGADIAVDEDGAIYITGWTESQNLPTNGFGGEFAGVRDCFVAKLSADGANLEHASYLGHGDEDECNAVAINGDGEMVVAGATRSLDFPTTDGVTQGENRGERDAFVTKVSADGQQIVYSTFIGGVGNDTAHDVALDGDGWIYVVGDTDSNDFPISDDARQNLRRARDGFLAKLSADAATLEYGSFIGGSTDDLALGVAIGLNGEIHVVGESDSPDLELSANPAQSGRIGEEADMFLAIFDDVGADLLYATYLGGDERDFANDVAVDLAGRIYVVGATESGNFPLTGNALLPEFRGDQDAFLVQFERAGLGILHSTYFGGGDQDEATAVAVSEAGDVYMAGITRSDNFPLSDNAFQRDFNDFEIGQLEAPTEAFVTAIAALPSERPFAVVSGASFRAGALAGGSIASGFGTGLADEEAHATTIPLPTELAGVRVQVTPEDGSPQDAALFYAGPEQVNFTLPEVTSPVPMLVEVVQDGEVVSSGSVQAVEVAPALFSADMSGTGPAAGFVVELRGDEQTRVPLYDPEDMEVVPVDLSDLDGAALELFGTGIRNAETVTATANGEELDVLFFGAAPDFVGLDQVNVQLSDDMAGAGEVQIQVTADGVESNTVMIAVE